tara:strand:- start:710 stop:1156 length:447 start_codon:yes stop_codon:yes gene_type:complete
MSNQVKSGNTVSVHYVGTLNDGTEFDSSRARGEAMSFTVGSGQLIAGFDQAVHGMTIGETKTVTLSPAEAYGDVQENLTQTVPTNAFPEGFDFTVGNQVMGHGPGGTPVVATIKEIQDAEIILDMNHPMAGKTLNFNIELVSIDTTEG